MQLAETHSGIRQVRLLSSSLLLFTACSSSASTDPVIPTVAGVYLLQRADGAVLPVPPPAPGSTDPCPAAITDGALSLGDAPQDRALPPLYTVYVIGSRACDPNGIPAEPKEVARDAGVWSASRDVVAFNSNARFGLGNYQGALQADASGPSISLRIGGHEYSFRKLDPTLQAFGTVAVAVLDQQGLRVGGALIVFHLSNGQVSRGVSSDAGPAFATSASPGSTRINIAPPSGYTFAQGQANPVIVPLSTERMTEVTVLLVRTAP